MRTLEFTKKEGRWVAEYVSEGPSVVQVERERPGELLFKAAVEDGMTPCVFKAYPTITGSANILTEVNLPTGAIITIESETEVSHAAMMDNVQPDIDPFACSDDPACYDVNNESLLVKEF